MKKFYILLIAVAILISFSSNAQVKFGIKGGLNISSLSNLDNNVPGVSSESTTGYHAGIMLEIKLPVLLGIQIDALYSTKGAKLTFTDPAFDFTIEQDLTYIDVPVVAKLYFLKFLNFQIGPQFSFLTKAEQRLTSNPPSSIDGTVDIEDVTKSTDISGIVGVGFEISKLYVSARYNFGLVDVNDDPNASTVDKIKNNVFQLTVGIWLKK